MFDFRRGKGQSRAGRARPVTLSLLGAIFLALVVIIVLLVRRPAGETSASSNNAGGGNAASRHEPPKPIENPGRIKQALQPGRKYEVVAKGGFDSRIEDKDWGVKGVSHVVFEYEVKSLRTIESNDGKTIVETRRYDAIRSAKLLTKVESVTFDLGLPGTLLLEGLVLANPEAGLTIIAAKQFAEKTLRDGAQAVADDASAKAFGKVDSLEGKEVRITYVDGKGVTAVEPLNGSALSPEERSFIETSAVLADCYLLPELNSKPGDAWKVDGRQITDFIDPTLRAVPRGAIFIERQADENRAGKHFAVLGVKSGSVELDATDATQARYGSLQPRGTLRFNLSDNYVAEGELRARASYERVSKDHLLFEARFRSDPEIKISYSCKMQ